MRGFAKFEGGMTIGPHATAGSGGPGRLAMGRVVAWAIVLVAGVCDLTAHAALHLNSSNADNGTNAYLALTGTLTLSTGGRLATTAGVSEATGATLVLGGKETIGSLGGSRGIPLGGHALTVGGRRHRPSLSSSPPVAGGPGL